MNTPPLAIVAGAGPGLGQRLVAYLNAHGYRAFGLNRSVPAGAGADTLVCDLTNPASVTSVIRDLSCTHGAPAIVIHNPAKLVIAPFEETEADEFEATWRSMVLSAVHLGKAVLPVMAEAGGGVFIVSGATASLRGGKNFSAFASAKSALRALTQSLAREYGAKGIHIAHVILDGIMDTEASRALHSMSPDRMMRTEDVAAAYLHLAQQPNSTWTHELDLRPMGESF